MIAYTVARIAAIAMLLGLVHASGMFASTSYAAIFSDNAGDQSASPIERKISHAAASSLIMASSFWAVLLAGSPQRGGGMLSRLRGGGRTARADRVFLCLAGAAALSLVPVFG